jgi:hypothetical protein
MSVRTKILFSLFSLVLLLANCTGENYSDIEEEDARIRLTSTQETDWSTKISNAAEAGNTEKVWLIAESGLASYGFESAAEEAISNKDIETFKVISERDSVGNINYDHLLESAVSDSAVRIVDYITSNKKAKTNLVYGLSEAATRGYREIADNLLSAGAEPDTCHHKEPIVSRALENKNLKTANMLIEKGARLKGYYYESDIYSDVRPCLPRPAEAAAFGAATRSGSIKLLEAITGPDRLSPEDNGAMQLNFETVLVKAACYGHIEWVERKVREGANAESLDRAVMYLDRNELHEGNFSPCSPELPTPRMGTMEENIREARYLTSYAD